MTKRNIPIGSVLLWVAVGLAFLTVISLFTSLGNGGGGDAGITERPTTTATTAPVTTAPPVTTAAPITTAPPVTTAPPAEPEEPELTPGQELVRDIVAVNAASGSCQNGDRFHMADGDYHGVYVPVSVPEKGIYRISFDFVENSGSDYFSVYIRNGYADAYGGFVVEVFDRWDKQFEVELALPEGANQLYLWLKGQSLDITSVTYEKVGDYDIAVTDFTGSGVGATLEWSGCPRLNFSYEEGQLSSVIRSSSFTVVEAGEYALSFIAGSKCPPVVRIIDSTGDVLEEFVYLHDWNEWGVDPLYNNSSTVYINSGSPSESETTKTVELVAGEYTIEVAFGDVYANGDTILVHSAYLTKK